MVFMPSRGRTVLLVWGRVACTAHYNAFCDTTNIVTYAVSLGNSVKTRVFMLLSFCIRDFTSSRGDENVYHNIYHNIEKELVLQLSDKSFNLLIYLRTLLKSYFRQVLMNKLVSYKICWIPYNWYQLNGGIIFIIWCLFDVQYRKSAWNISCIIIFLSLYNHYLFSAFH